MLSRSLFKVFHHKSWPHSHTIAFSLLSSSTLPSSPSWWLYDDLSSLPGASLKAPLLQGLRQRRPAKIKYCISRGHFFKRMHWKFERNLSCWMFRQKDNSGTWMSLIFDFVCPCVCFVCLLVCLLFMFLFDWWLAVCMLADEGTTMLYNYQHSTWKKNSTLNRQGDNNAVQLST